MPFRVNYKGLEVEVDSIDDLDALAARINGNSTRRAAGPPRTDKTERPVQPTIDADSPIENRLKAFVAALNENARRVYKDIAQYAQPINDVDLRERLKINSNNELAGYLAGITRAAKKAALDPDVVLTKVTRDNRPKHRAYQYSIPAGILDDVRRIMKIS